MLLKEKKRFDYYAFGSPMPGRQFNSNSYRYGFNSKENDNEVKGTGNQQDYGLRIYDPRLGKFLSVDPLSKEYPWNSTYAFAEGDVIRSVDLDGGEKKIVVQVYYGDAKNPKVVQKTVNWRDIHPGESHGPLGNGVLRYVYHKELNSIYKKEPKSTYITSVYDESKYLDDETTKKNLGATHSGKGTGSNADGVDDVKIYDPHGGNTNPNFATDGGKEKYTDETASGTTGIVDDPPKVPNGTWSQDYTYKGEKIITAHGKDGDSTEMYGWKDNKPHTYKKDDPKWAEKVRAADTLEKGELKKVQ